MMDVALASGVGSARLALIMVVETYCQSRSEYCIRGERRAYVSIIILHQPPWYIRSACHHRSGHHGLARHRSGENAASRSCHVR